MGEFEDFIFVPYSVEIESENRMKNILTIQSDISDINNLFKDLNYYVNSQQENIDSIESSIESSKKNVMKASEELDKAEEYQKKGLKLKTKLLIAVGVVTGIPLGIAFGPKIAVGVTCGIIVTSAGLV